MVDVSGEEKKQRILALGRLGWSLRQIEATTGVRREWKENWRPVDGPRVAFSRSKKNRVFRHDHVRS
jgi:hypothetical protein